MTKPAITSTQERRYLGRPVEIRAAADGTATRTIVFYASVYNTKSNLLNDGWEQFREIIAPGAFDEVLAQDTVCNRNHDDDCIIARTTAGNLRITSDNIGLRCEVDVPNTTAGNDLLEDIRVGNITQSSFCFQIAPEGDSWQWTEADGYTRTINKISRLWDVSMVVWPAYNEAGIAEQDARNNLQVAARSLKEFVEKQKPAVEPFDEVRAAELRLKFRKK